MIIRWRPWLFAVLLIGLVLSLELGEVFSSVIEDYRIDVADITPIDDDSSVDTPAITPPSQTSHVINVYDFGVVKIEAPEVATEPLVEPEPPVVVHETPPPPLPVRPEPVVGAWPALEADYDGIGFDRYLSTVEKVGQFSMLVRQEGQLRLGPELSLDQRIIFHASSSDMGLALERPHLVTGPEVQNRLQSMALPSDAIVDSVVLAFEQSFDQRLWARIAQGLADFGLGVTDVNRIRGAYVERDGGIILTLIDAVARSDGRVIMINDEIEIY